MGKLDKVRSVSLIARSNYSSFFLSATMVHMNVLVEAKRSINHTMGKNPPLQEYSV